MSGDFLPLPPSILPSSNAGADETIKAAAADPVDPAYRKKANEAALKFESFFIAQMLHKMRDSTRTLAADDSPNKSSVHDDMLDMADNLVADQLANRRAFGVADVLLRQLLPAAPAAPAHPLPAAVDKKPPTA
ncbi:rod-binding protein [Massilia endophytica]|uniref:rod-binding protein n=1 Tax=Massilia endophytica TaxID=2899220 RepID=UPI001E591F98|nr:rod-binding protein [Massilia endophytica]UGQ48985.1 rod-binding protein [Massilia endophytica]